MPYVYANIYIYIYIDIYIHITNPHSNNSMNRETLASKHAINIMAEASISIYLIYPFSRSPQKPYPEFLQRRLPQFPIR